MKILVVGGSGTIGSAVASALSVGNEVVTAGRSSGDYRVDIASSESIAAMYMAIGELDAVVSCAGQGAFGSLDELSEAKIRAAVDSKLMGQVNLARLGIPRVRGGGSITLTSGVLAHEPTAGSAAISMVNAGLEAFAAAAALELPRGIRINVVSPPWVSETLAAMGKNAGDGLAAAKVAEAYRAAVEGDLQGRVIDARTFA